MSYNVPFKESIEGHLKIQLSHRVVNQEGDCLIFDVDSKDINKASIALHAHCSLAEEFAEQFATDSFASYVANVWKLCVALWGTLPDVNVAAGVYSVCVSVCLRVRVRARVCVNSQLEHLIFSNFSIKRQSIMYKSCFLFHVFVFIYIRIHYGQK